MSEVTFAKTFLTQLDKKPIKYPSDSVSDPKKHPSQSPFTLPKQSHPFPKRQRTSAPTTSITVALKPMRGGGETVTLSSISLDSSIHDVKTQYAQQTGVSMDKIKLLLNKKPAADLKTFQELGVAEDVELSVMLMGGAGTPRSQTPAPTPSATEQEAAAPEKMDLDPQSQSDAAPGSEKAQMEVDEQPKREEQVADVVKTDAFWSDLKGFLAQRLKDEGESERLVGLFRKTVTG